MDYNQGQRPPRGTADEVDPYGRWILGPGGSTAGILRYKEAETIPVPNFPTGPQIPQFRMTMARTLAASTGRYDQAEINWFVSEGFGPGITFETLANSGLPRFRSLDMKLSVCLSKMVRNANNQLSIDLATIEEKMIEGGTMLMGRQIAWKLYMYYQTNPICDFTYGVTDLTNLPWQGDNQVANFLGCWRLIIRKMRTQLTDDELGEILYNKIKNSKDMANDLAHYERQELNHPDRSYAYLTRCMERRLQNAQLERNRANDQAAIRSGNVSGFGKLAVPATSGGNPPGKKAAAKAKALAAKALASSTADIDARIAAGIAAAVKGKGKGKGDGPPGGKGAGKGKGKPDFKQTPCWFFNCHANGCTKEAKDCTHKHVKVSAAEAAKLFKPGTRPADGSGARSPSPGKGGGKQAPPAPANEWCRKYLEGNCQLGADCPYVHLEPPIVKIILAKRKAASAKAKAKAKAKAQP